MELVDIIDEQKNHLYVVSKEEAHIKGLLHKIIIAEIIDSKGNKILVKQASDRQDPGQYVSPVGGHIQAGEDELSALKRESLEEVGIEPVKYKKIGEAIYRRKVLNRDENHMFILYEIYSDQSLSLNHESVSYKKFTDIEIQSNILTNEMGDAFRFVIKKFYPRIYPET